MEFTVCGGQVPPAASFRESKSLRMYLLYLDGSGSVGNPTERHFVLAGIAVFDFTVAVTLADSRTIASAPATSV